MTLILYYHPFSSYCQKVLMALYEKEVAFSPYQIDLGDQRQKAEFAAIWPYAKFPVLHDIDAGVTLPESTIIAEYVDGLSSASPRLIPAEPAEARTVRLFDRLIDNYLQAPLQKIVGDRLRPEGKSDAFGVEEARATIATTCAMIERRLGFGAFITGSDFNLADCAIAPPLFYVAKLMPLEPYPALNDYLQRIMKRPSFRRCLDDALPYRRFFPSAVGDQGWPDTEPRIDF